MGKIILGIMFIGSMAYGSIFPKGTRFDFPKQIAKAQRTKAEVDAVINIVKTKLEPDFKARGLTVFYYNEWHSAEFNAYASYVGYDLRMRKIQLMGGLSKSQYITLDGLKMVLCHEVGHHIGGAPLYSHGYMSSEGQSDYYATLHCFRKLHSTVENLQWKSVSKPHLLTFNICKQDISCQRSVEAARVVMKLLSYGRVELDTPDNHKAGYTLRDEYPENQCRLDTYVAGALYRARPECWYVN